MAELIIAIARELRHTHSAGWLSSFLEVPIP
jgi:hypothetical protein